MGIKIYKINYAARARWGICPVCGARHGEPCVPVASDEPRGGTHVARLVNAPVVLAKERDE